jgi:Cd(II)/Pb(II)-responsive transcriptional regulator
LEGKTYRIGDLSSGTGIPVETIRYYERQGLLPAPSRSQNNYRLYVDAHLKRLQFVRNCRSLDMTLEEIRSLLAFQDASEASCDGVNDLLDRHIGHVATRIAELQALKKQLEALRGQCATVHVTKACEILHGLNSPASEDAFQGRVHGGGCH